MKKVFVILLTVALVLSMAGSVYGKTIDGSDTLNPGKTATSTVTLTLTDSYVVTIPDDFDLDDVDVGGDGTIDYYSTSGIVKGKIKHIAENYDLVVSIETQDYISENGWMLKKLDANGDPSADEDDWYQYYMRAGDHVEDINEIDLLVTDTNPDVLTVPYDMYNEKTIELHVKLVGALPTVAGKYQDTLTFKVKTIPQTTP